MVRIYECSEGDDRLITDDPGKMFDFFRKRRITGLVGQHLADISFSVGHPVIIDRVGYELPPIFMESYLIDEPTEE